MTEARLNELADLCKWWGLQIDKINSAESKRPDYGTYEYIHPDAAHEILNAWYKEKEAALGATQDEWDEYECANDYR